jgi:hypothetical protein
MQMLWGRRVQRHPAHDFWSGSGRRNVQRLGALYVDTAWLSYVRHGMASVKADEDLRGDIALHQPGVAKDYCEDGKKQIRVRF